MTSRGVFRFLSLYDCDAIYCTLYLSVFHNSADHRNRLEGLIELVADGARGVVEISASQQVLASFAMPPGESIRLAWCGWQGSQIIYVATASSAPASS